MKKIKSVIFGVVIGLVLGLWFGINFGKQQSIFSNPFAKTDLSGKLKQKVTEAAKDTRRKLRESLKD